MQLRASLDGTGNPTAIQYTEHFAGNITFSRKVNQVLNFGSLTSPVSVSSSMAWHRTSAAEPAGFIRTERYLSFGTASCALPPAYTVRWESDPGVFFFPLQADA
jgi:hypothetical protein